MKDSSTLTTNMDCSKEDLTMNEKDLVNQSLCNHCNSESDTIEGGYVSCEELDDDSEILDDTESVSPTVSSNDPGYISSHDDDKLGNCEENLILKLSDADILHHEINIEESDLPESLRMFVGGINIGLPQDCIDEKPEWLDLEKFKAGQKFAMDYYFGLNYSQMISLFILFSFPEGLKPLVFTDKSSTPFTAYRRYLSTVLRVRSWFENDLWSAGNEGFQNIKSVRAMHLSVSNRLNNSPMEEIKKDLILEGSERHPSLWCPLNSKLKDYLSSSSCPTSKCTAFYDKTRENRTYFNQIEMSITQFGFFGLMIMYPENFGAGGATREELESYVHLWKGIGYLLGIKDEYNFCRGTFEEVRQRCHDVVDHLVKPNFCNLSKDFEHMSRCMIAGVNHYIPVYFESSLAYLCWIIGIDCPKLISSMTWLRYIMFQHMKFFFRFTLRIPGLLPLANRMVIQAVDRTNRTSPERLEYLKNKQYSYQKDNVITRL